MRHRIRLTPLIPHGLPGLHVPLFPPDQWHVLVLVSNRMLAEVVWAETNNGLILALPEIRVMVGDEVPQLLADGLRHREVLAVLELLQDGPLYVAGE